MHLFTQWCDRETMCQTHIMGSPWELVRHPDFRRCDIAIFHWGIHFALFDAITLLEPPELRPAVVHFHNCTPPSLVGEGRARPDPAVDPPDAPRHLDGVPLWTYSEFNRRTLVDWGAEREQMDSGDVPARDDARPSDRRDGRRSSPPLGRPAGAGEGDPRVDRCVGDAPGDPCSSASVSHRQQLHVLLHGVPDGARRADRRECGTAGRCRRVLDVTLERRVGPL